jgi:hypothetical protein
MPSVNERFSSVSRTLSPAAVSPLHFHRRRPNLLARHDRVTARRGLSALSARPTTPSVPARCSPPPDGALCSSRRRGPLLLRHGPGATSAPTWRCATLLGPTNARLPVASDAPTSSFSGANLSSGGVAFR